ncbi:MAG TPA: VIT domain-containing protein, partial [Ramlibacter sp.]|nr:VIT domain-containing protein [Ramlibacter sp.]
MQPTTCPSMSPATGLARWLCAVAASAAAACFLTLAPAAHAQEAGPRLVTESPYFFIKGGDPDVDRLPLKSTKVDVRISGVIADVTVTQQYKNEGTRPIEAKYVFPGSTQAAVHGMNVRLGGRLITAQIREKQQARI